MRAALIIVSLLILVVFIVAVSGSVGSPGPMPGDPVMPVTYPHPTHVSALAATSHNARWRLFSCCGRSGV